MLPLPLAKDGFVRCGNCGFLCIDRIMIGRGRTVTEISFRGRQTGETSEPSCSVRSPSFNLDYGNPNVEMPAADILREISKEIECGFYVAYVPLHSPKEHAALRFEAHIREESARRDKEMRDWQAQQEEVRAKRHEEQKEAEKEWQLKQKAVDQAFQIQQARINRQWSIFYGTIIAAISLLVGYLLKR